MDEASCIAEKGLDFSTVDMADVTKLPSESMASCVNYCLGRHPDKSHLLISYYNAALVGDQFNCLCANKDTFAKNKRLPGTDCDRKCPNSQYK